MAVQKLKPLTTPKGCRGFAGIVNFVSIFCLELQKLLKPIYDLTRKGRPFIWEDEQQKVFEEIKSRLQKCSVLSMPDRKGRFILYFDTSKLATGSALYQIQDGKPKLIAYVSKRMSDAAKTYSITELEMCGLAINIGSFAHLLKRVDFHAVVDHLAIMQIMKSKMEPATNRIKRLLEILSTYFFNLYYIKGKDMVLSDFLSRQQGDRSDPHQIIPISFYVKDVLRKNYQDIVKDTFMVQTQSKGVKIPPVWDTTKSSDKTERREIKPVVIEDTPIVIDLDAKLDLDTQVQNAVVTQQYDPTRPGVRQTPVYSHPTARPPPGPPDLADRRSYRTDIGADPNLDFEENSPPTRRNNYRNI